MTDVQDQTSPQIEVRNLKTYFYTEDGVVRAVDGLSYRLAKGSRTVSLSVALVDGAAISWLYDHGQVLGRRDDERFAHLRVNLDPADLARFHRRQVGSTGGKRKILNPKHRIKGSENP